MAPEEVLPTGGVGETGRGAGRGLSGATGGGLTRKGGGRGRKGGVTDDDWAVPLRARSKASAVPESHAVISFVFMVEGKTEARLGNWGVLLTSKGFREVFHRGAENRAHGGIVTGLGRVFPGFVIAGFQPFGGRRNCDLGRRPRLG